MYKWRVESDSQPASEAEDENLKALGADDGEINP